MGSLEKVFWKSDDVFALKELSKVRELLRSRAVLISFLASSPFTLNGKVSVM